MKKKFLKYFIPCFFAVMFMFSVSSCNNETKYLKGEGCGQATVDGTNAFSQIRRVYCEQFVYECNLGLVGDEKEYASYAEVYKQKFVYTEDNQLQLVTEGSDQYSQSHYIFTYYEGDKIEVVKAYINSNVTPEPQKYLELVELCATGKKTGEETSTVEKYGYFVKVNNTNYDGDTINSVKSVKERMTAHSKACLVFTDNFADPDTGVIIPKTSYKDAWDVGFLYGLFVYPMAWLINVFVVWFGSTGWAQVGAILVVTFILKILILLITFKSQSSTQKMQDIQPEILKIQNKYGPTPSAADKQRMSMELMAVYQKYGVKPLAPLASLLITFPVFIAMYRAVMYLGILRTGNIGGVILGNVLSTYIIGGNGFNFVALIIFLIMAASQILSMKLPQILNRKRMSPEAKKQQKQMGMMSNFMMIMILVMGFLMPITMSIYWIASAIVGVTQSIIMHKLNNGNKKGKYKVKKAESEPIKIPQGYKK